MHHQPELPLGMEEQRQSERRRELTLDERFRDFHASHPWVLEALEELTTRWVRAGGGRIGIKALFEQLRWSAPRSENGEPMKLNNDFTSRYARLLRDRHPEWADVFQLRTLRTGSEDGS